MKTHTLPASVDQGTYGYLAEYPTPQALLSACEVVRDAGYTMWDAHTPFPVHGIDRAMSLRPTILPWLVLAGGVGGLILGFMMQVGLNAMAYPWIVSGKPLWSVPAFVPVAFETTILVAALTAFGACLGLNKLPRLHHPLFQQLRFAKATDDAFFIAIEAEDELFDPQKTKVLLERTSPSALETVPDNRQESAKMPRPIIYGAVLVAFLSVVPFALIAQARYTKSREPRINLVANMDHQEKYKSQRATTFFADKRTMRQPIPGTVAQDSLALDDHYERGVAAGTSDRFVTDFPREFTIDAASMQQGRARFDMYCSPCHGAAGYGDGMVARRAEELAEGTWVTPTSLHDPRLFDVPVGYLFNVISNGARNMPGYASQVTVDQRWSIVLYIRALQRSQAARLEDVPESLRESLR